MSSKNNFSTSLPNSSVLASPTKFRAMFDGDHASRNNQQHRGSPSFKSSAKRPVANHTSKRLLDNGTTSATNHHHATSTAIAINRNNSNASNGYQYRRNSFGRPSSVDIDSFYDDDSEDLMTRFSNDVRRSSHKNSNKSRTRYGRGLAKKNGAGGHFTWGVVGSELDEQTLAAGNIDPVVDNSDPMDPNYDSESEENCKFETIMPPLDEAEVDKFVPPVLQEYFEHGDTSEVASVLFDVNLSGNYHKIVSYLVMIAMERKSSHREFASLLISSLFDNVLTCEDIEAGFDVLLSQLDDLVLDTPDASVVLGNFIGRAVADDCIPPRYITSRKEKLESKPSSDLTKADLLAIKAIEHANTLITVKRGLIRLDTVWGLTGGARPVKYLIKQMRSILKEYLLSLDDKEAERCLRELEVPHFYHEFVYEAILMGIEDVKNDSDLNAIAKLLKALTDINLISLEQLKKGFLRLFSELPEIQIDVPRAYSTLEKFMQKCFTEKLFLPPSVVENVPSRGRKRFISENNDGGRIKE